MSREKLIEALKEETLFKAKSIKDTALDEAARIVSAAEDDCAFSKSVKLSAIKNELADKSAAASEDLLLTLESVRVTYREELFQEMVLEALDEVMADKDGSYKALLLKIYFETVQAFKSIHGDETFDVYLHKDDKKLMGSAKDLIGDELKKGTISVRSGGSNIEFQNSVKGLIEEVSSINRIKLVKAVFGG